MGILRGLHGDIIGVIMMSEEALRVCGAIVGLCIRV